VSRYQLLQAGLSASRHSDIAFPVDEVLYTTMRDVRRGQRLPGTLLLYSSVTRSAPFMDSCSGPCTLAGTGHIGHDCRRQGDS